MGSPVDDALDRLDDCLGRAERLAYEHKAEWVGLFQGGASDLATVRSALEQLREERDASVTACEKAIRERRSLEQKEDDWHSAYERAEAEVQRLREGLREAETGFNDISLILEAENDGYQERAYKRAMEELRHVRALLAANPPQGDAEGSSPTDGGGA